MSLPVNAARGEVALKIGNVDLVIAATMEGLSKVSSRLECKSMADLFARLTGVEVATALAAIEFLSVGGDAKAALKVLNLSDFPALANALAQALSHHFKDDAGKDAAAREEAAG